MYAVGGGWLCDSALFASARECYLPKLARACTAARLKRLELFLVSYTPLASHARDLMLTSRVRNTIAAK